MGFWIFMLCSNLLLPVLMIFFGKHFQNHPPREIKTFAGQRGSMAVCAAAFWKAVVPAGQNFDSTYGACDAAGIRRVGRNCGYLGKYRLPHTVCSVFVAVLFYGKSAERTV